MRRRALVVVAATLALLGALHAVVYALYRDATRTLERALDDRLEALGQTTAGWLDVAPPERWRDQLRALAQRDRLEEAVVLDDRLHVVAGARAPAGTRFNLLRLDAARLGAARRGRASIGGGYAVAGARIQSGYFPAGGGRVLLLEAGAGYRAPVGAVRETYLWAVGLSLASAALFSSVVALALRALERARVAHGRDERLVAVGQLAAMVAHEVRNPLGIVRAQAELLRERLEATLAPRDRERIDEMLGEIERISRLTDEFLELSRETPLERAPCDVRALVEQTVRGLRELPLAARATLEVEVGPGALVVVADGPKLRQALLNVTLNALQSSDGEVRVRIAAARRQRRVEIQVADDGPGVPPALVRTLFDPFVSGRRGGSGLGLAIARRVVERHGGELSLLPTPPGERGAIFCLSLPDRAASAWPPS